MAADTPTERIWRPTERAIDPSTMQDVGTITMRVTSPYGWRRDPLRPGELVFHDGLDIGNARLGDVIVADMDSTVAEAGALKQPWSTPTTQWPSGNYGGYMIVLDHGSWVSVYAHMQADLKVRKGDRVKLGQHIGLVGESGAASPPQGGHLHYGHIMLPVSAIVALGATRKPTRDPWPLIDPKGPMPAQETRIQRLERRVLEFRRSKPKAAARWKALTQKHLGSSQEGDNYDRDMRLTAEHAALTLAPDE